MKIQSYSIFSTHHFDRNRSGICGRPLTNQWTSDALVCGAVGALLQYRLERENGEESDSISQFPSGDFERLDIDEVKSSNKWPEGCRYWLSLQLEDGTINNDFYWMPDKIRGYPDENNKDRYWFSIHHAPSNTTITGFSQEPDYELGFPTRGDTCYYYAIRFSDEHSPAIRQWMNEKDLNYLDRIENENPALYIQEVAAHPDIQRRQRARQEGRPEEIYDESEVVQDYARAVEQIHIAANQGDVLAQSRLAAMYYNGQGVVQNGAKALELFRLAATQGDASAQSNLGVMFENGYGVEQDYIEALKWFRLALAQYDASASSAIRKLEVKVKKQIEAQIEKIEKLSRSIRVLKLENEKEIKRMEEIKRNFPELEASYLDNPKIHTQNASKKIKNLSSGEQENLQRRLIQACLNADLDEVKLLIEEEGADASGIQPLAAAIWGLSFSIVRYLENKVKYTQKDYEKIAQSLQSKYSRLLPISPEINQFTQLWSIEKEGYCDFIFNLEELNKRAQQVKEWLSPDEASSICLAKLYVDMRKRKIPPHIPIKINEVEIEFKNIEGDIIESFHYDRRRDPPFFINITPVGKPGGSHFLAMILCQHMAKYLQQKKINFNNRYELVRVRPTIEVWARLQKEAILELENSIEKLEKENEILVRNLKRIRAALINRTPLIEALDLEQWRLFSPVTAFFAKKTRRSVLKEFDSSKGELQEALVKACADSNIEKVKKLVEEGADPDMPNKAGEYPLAIAIWTLSFDIVTYLESKVEYSEADYRQIARSLQSDKSRLLPISSETTSFSDYLWLFERKECKFMFDGEILLKKLHQWRKWLERLDVLHDPTMESELQCIVIKLSANRKGTKIFCTFMNNYSDPPHYLHKPECLANDPLSDEELDRPGSSYYFCQYMCRTMAQYLRDRGIDISLNYELVDSNSSSAEKRLSCS